MRVNFILPSLGATPIGGFKVVYEYANGLVKTGNIVNVIHPMTMNNFDSLYKRAKAFRWYMIYKINKSYRPDNWFKLDPRVNVVLVPNLEERYIPNADFLFATAWDTAEKSNVYSFKKGKKYYLIQNYEIWNAGKNRVLKTFRLSFKKIVISRWLEKLVNSQGEDAYYIPNGFDSNAFEIDIKPEGRNKYTLMMLYHSLSLKGSYLGLRAIKKLKQIIPDLKLILFGAYLPPKKLPDWISFHEKPDQLVLRKLYNEAAIFISPSFLEGFPLPPAEAMLSGSTLIASNIGGHREYAIHNKTAILYPPKDIHGLVNSIHSLIDHNNFRINLAYEGHAFIKQFTWEKSVKDLEIYLKNDL